MKKIDRAVEIIRGWSDEELKGLIIKSNLKPCMFAEMKNCKASVFECVGNTPLGCWNEEVEE